VCNGVSDEEELELELELELEDTAGAGHELVRFKGPLTASNSTFLLFSGAEVGTNPCVGDLPSETRHGSGSTALLDTTESSSLELRLELTLGRCHSGIGKGWGCWTSPTEEVHVPRPSSLVRDRRSFSPTCNNLKLECRVCK
jgi:hypothetical protein